MGMVNHRLRCFEHTASAGFLVYLYVDMSTGLGCVSLACEALVTLGVIVLQANLELNLWQLVNLETS